MIYTGQIVTNNVIWNCPSKLLFSIGMIVTALYVAFVLTWYLAFKISVVRPVISGNNRTLYTRSHILWFTHCIKVCDIPHKTEFRSNIISKICQNLEIYLNYAFNLDLCCYNIVWTPTCFNVWCMAKQQSQNFCVKKTSNFPSVQPVTIGCIHMLSWMHVSFSECAAQLSLYTTVLDRYKITLRSTTYGIWSVKTNL